MTHTEPRAPHLPQDGDVLYRRERDAYAPSPFEARRVIPTGRVSPDGTRAWPRPSSTSTWLVWGGIGLAAAAATAGGVLVVRKVVDAVAGDPDPQPNRRRVPARPQPQRYALSPEEQQRRIAARRRAEAARAAATPQSLVGSVNETVAGVTHSLRDTMASITAGIEGFRRVSQQAGSVLREFQGAADQVRSFLEPSDPSAGTGMPRNTHARPAKRDVVDLRDDVMVDDARTHRL